MRAKAERRQGRSPALGQASHPNLTLSPARQRPYPGHRTIIAGRGAMDIDWKAEMKRPVTLGLAALAVIGWIFAISQLSAKTSLQASTSSQIGQLTAARQQLATELDQQQKASGTLIDMQKRTEEATAAADRAARDREAAAAQLADTNKAIEAVKGSLTGAEAELNAVTEQITQRRAASTEAESALTQSR